MINKGTGVDGYEYEASLFRVSSSDGDEVLLRAEKVTHRIFESYTRPPINFEDLYKLARDPHVDPLKEFTDACREERKVMLKAL